MQPSKKVHYRLRDCVHLVSWNAFPLVIHTRKSNADAKRLSCNVVEFNQHQEQNFLKLSLLKKFVFFIKYKLNLRAVNADVFKSSAIP